MNNIDFSERLAKMWRDSRYRSGRSQEYMAKALGVSKKTVQNWEAGTASPNLRTAFQWFETIGVPMYPYLMSLLYPQEIDGITPDTGMEDLRMALHTYLDELDDLHVRELLYILHGSHGSSPTGTLDVFTAYLHLPLAMRICITESIMANYEMASLLGAINDDDHVMPKAETLERYIQSAKDAVKHGKESYVLSEELE